MELVDDPGVISSPVSVSSLPTYNSGQYRSKVGLPHLGQGLDLEASSCILLSFLIQQLVLSSTTKVLNSKVSIDILPFWSRLLFSLNVWKYNWKFYVSYLIDSYQFHLQGCFNRHILALSCHIHLNDVKCPHSPYHCVLCTRYHYVWECFFYRVGITFNYYRFGKYQQIISIV